MRQNFRFSSKQRKILYILSLVKHQEKNLVLSKYIKSVFSRWSGMKKDDLLKSISREDN